MNTSTRFLAPLFVLFVVINILVFALKQVFVTYNVNASVLLGANALFLLMNILVFLFQKKALQHANPNVFIRSVIGGMMFKMFVCAIAVLAYVVLVGPEYNKKAVFISMFFYLFYLAAEVFLLMRVNNKKNA